MVAATTCTHNAILPAVNHKNDFSDTAKGEHLLNKTRLFFAIFRVHRRFRDMKTNQTDAKYPSKSVLLRLYHNHPFLTRECEAFEGEIGVIVI